MKARYASNCALCTGDIHRGDEIELIRQRGRQRATHASCYAAERAAAAATRPKKRPIDTIDALQLCGPVDPGWERRQADQQAATRAQHDRIQAKSDLIRNLRAEIKARRRTTA